MCRLENRVQEYAWGSRSWIPELLGRSSPADRPQAELWMGDHPQGPSSVLLEGEKVPLPELIARYPREILGAEVYARFGARLPFLLKILAAEEPLSIQAHPALEQAREGFAREEDLGIARAGASRNYRDENHKPECLCALTEFWALCGFRPVAEMLDLLRILLPAADHELLDPLEKGALRLFFAGLIGLETKRRVRLIRAAVTDATRIAADGGAEALTCTWIVELQKRHPGDFGVLAPAFLNLIRLSPGQAIALPAGELHAYLRGLGVELMSNSDNVLRGGLTRKHVDPAELLRVLRFDSRDVEVLEAVPHRPGEAAYSSEADEFVLSTIRSSPRRPFLSQGDHGVEILFCSAGKGTLRQKESVFRFGRGASFLVPAAGGGYEIDGEATLYKAAVPAGPGRAPE
ncbi:MAG: mannose-6-phosphate isomerase, class I [Gemmatimonadetes bacterium]|nr:mannose-6-phosphate isomerase, class I [Gemmatimonadota bacterium]